MPFNSADQYEDKRLVNSAHVHMVFSLFRPMTDRWDKSIGSLAYCKTFNGQSVLDPLLFSGARVNNFSKMGLAVCHSFRLCRVKHVYRRCFEFQRVREERWLMWSDVICSFMRALCHIFPVWFLHNRLDVRSFMVCILKKSTLFQIRTKSYK